jgi:hypothetical protein
LPGGSAGGFAGILVSGGSALATPWSAEPGLDGSTATASGGALLAGGTRSTPAHPATRSRKKHPMRRMDCLIDFSAGFSAALLLIHFPIRKIYFTIMVAVS